MTITAPTAGDLRRLAENSWAQEPPHDSLQAAWAALDLDSESRATKVLLARLLRHHPSALQSERTTAYLKLLTRREVEPDLISTAGSLLWLRSHPCETIAGDVACEAALDKLEHDELALTLVRESPVYFALAERLLTRMRRQLLLSARWNKIPSLLVALKDQATLNGGAWPFDERERAQLENSPLASANLPERTPRVHSPVSTRHIQ